MLRSRLGIFCFLFFFLLCKVPAEASLIDDKEEYIIVIDPGHGGKNTGSISNENYDEKEITLKTAFALEEELSKYEKVTVYLTHENDKDMTLEERAKFAAKMNADILVSIHFNASESHTDFGSEVWIPLEAPYHAFGYQFAYMQQLQMKNMGLFVRGIKTRVGEEGNDYYGIIRECVAREIPAVIVEHCYIDEERDSTFCETDEDFAEFGRRDAIAIAQFLGLEEYTGPEELLQLSIEAKIKDTYEDETSPDLCEISVKNYDAETDILTVTVSGLDAESALMYYDYSLDGGKSYSNRFIWPGCDMLTGEYDNSFSFLAEVSESTDHEILFRAYNKFGLSTESNILSTVEYFESLAEASQSNDLDIKEVDQILDTHTDHNKDYYLWIIAVLAVFVVLIPVLYCIYSKKHFKEENE